jgi:xanthine dehydrogenase accessory factor
MTCGGWVSVYFEVRGRALGWNVAIFGAGHIAQVPCRFLAELDCRVTCIDTRPEWLERLPRSAKLEAVRVADFPDGLERVVPGSDVLVMTMGHRADLPILRAIHARGLACAHLGVVGSGGKAKALRQQLLADGLPAAFVERIVCPLGDKLGNNTPPEIALGIVSQLLRLRQPAHAS